MNVVYSTQFRKDYKLCQKRGYKMKNLTAIMFDLESQVPLQTKNKEHQLKGKYAGYSECHIEPDWLLIYRINEQNEELYFDRTGTHADLFE